MVIPAVLVVAGDHDGDRRQANPSDYHQGAVYLDQRLDAYLALDYADASQLHHRVRGRFHVVVLFHIWRFVWKEGVELEIE